MSDHHQKRKAFTRAESSFNPGKNKPNTEKEMRMCPFGCICYNKKDHFGGTITKLCVKFKPGDDGNLKYSI